MEFFAPYFNQDTDHLSDYAKVGRAAPDDRENDVGRSPTY